MARLQILELPEGTGDDRPPFVLVVDQCIPQRIALGADAPYRDYWQDLAQQIGARGAIVTPEIVDIPANDTSAYIQQAEEQAGPERVDEGAIRVEAQLKAYNEKREAIEQGHKAALLDALGMDRTRDWDDIRNATVGIRKERDAQAAAIERVRQLHRPVEFRDRGTICAECSGWDGNTTDNSPCGYEHCPTLKALDGKQPDA